MDVYTTKTLENAQERVTMALDLLGRHYFSIWNNDLIKQNLEMALQNLAKVKSESDHAHKKAAQKKAKILDWSKPQNKIVEVSWPLLHILEVIDTDVCDVTYVKKLVYMALESLKMVEVEIEQAQKLDASQKAENLDLEQKGHETNEVKYPKSRNSFTKKNIP